MMKQSSNTGMTNQFSFLKALYKTERKAFIVKLIQDYDAMSLLKVAVEDEILDAILSMPELDEYWLAILNSVKKVRLYHSLETISNYHLVKGWYHYSLYVLEKESEERAHNNLVLSAKCGFFEALHLLLKRHIKSRIPEDVRTVNDLANQMKRIYPSVGFYVMSKCYYNVDDYRHAYEELLIAEMLLPYSKEMLDNAFQHMPIHILSAEEFKSLKVYKQNIIDNGKLSPLEQNQLAYAAKQKSDEIISGLKQEEAKTNNSVLLRKK